MQCRRNCVHIRAVFSPTLNFGIVVQVGFTGAALLEGLLTRALNIRWARMVYENNRT